MGRLRHLAATQRGFKLRCRRRAATPAGSFLAGSPWQPSKVNFLLPWLQLSGPPRSDICAGVPSADTAGKAAVILLRLGSGVGSGTARFAGCRVAPAPQAFFQLRSRGRVFTGLVHLAPPTLALLLSYPDALLSHAS